MLFSSRSLTSSGNPVMNTVRTSSAAGWEAWGRRRAQRSAASNECAAAAPASRPPPPPVGPAQWVGVVACAAAAGPAAPNAAQLQGRLPAASLRACGRQRRCRWGWSVVKSRGRLDWDGIELRRRLQEAFGRLVSLVGALHGWRRGCRLGAIASDHGGAREPHAWPPRLEVRICTGRRLAAPQACPPILGRPAVS